MNLICKLLGHKWRDTSSRQYVKIEGKKVDCWVTERHCDRCNTYEIGGVIPVDYERSVLSGHATQPVVGILSSLNKKDNT